MTDLKFYTITIVGSGCWDDDASLEIEEYDFAARHQDYEDTWCKGEDAARLSEEREHLQALAMELLRKVISLQKALLAKSHDYSRNGHNND